MEKTLSQTEYKSKIKRVLISQRKIRAGIKKACKTINGWYDGKPLLLVGLLNGCFIFLSDLCRKIKVPTEIAFLKANSYQGTCSSGQVKVSLDISKDLSDYNVVLVEDIIDTGKTLSEIIKIIQSRSPHSLRVVTLLDKPQRRKVDVKVDLSLFTIPDLFVIGYGLDCDQYFRNLPFIAEYKE